MAHVHLLGDVRTREIDDDCLRFPDLLNTQMFLFIDIAQGRGNKIRPQSKVNKAGSRNLGVFTEIADMELLDDLLGESAGIGFELLGERHYAVGLIIAELGVRSRSDNGRTIGPSRGSSHRGSNSLFKYV